MPGFEVIDSQEKEIVNKIFDDGGILFAHGFDAARSNFHVREFEESFNDILRFNHSLAVSSGTAAIKIGLKALDVKAGDQVLFGKYSGTEIKVDGEELLVMKEDDIVAIFEG